jgi:predicted histone-like DNA-binding protein
MSVLYRLYQNQNKKNTKAYGKWYAKAVHTNVYDTDKLAEEVQRNCSMKKSDIKAVIEELIEVMARELGNSHAVKLDGLGLFRVGIRSEGSVTVREFNAAKDITGTRINFLPERRKDASTQSYSSNLTRGWSIKEAPKNTVMPEPKEDEGSGGGDDQNP